MDAGAQVPSPGSATGEPRSCPAINDRGRETINIYSLSLAGPKSLEGSRQQPAEAGLRSVNFATGLTARKVEAPSPRYSFLMA